MVAFKCDMCNKFLAGYPIKVRVTGTLLWVERTKRQDSVNEAIDESFDLCSACYHDSFLNKMR